MCQRNLKMLSSVQISFFVSMPSSFKRQISRSPEKADLQILSVFVTILVLLLNVTVIMDGRVRKFVVTSSSVSLVVSFLKELISVMALLLSFLNNTVAYQSILVVATFCFRCQLWHSVISDCWLNVFVVLVTGHVFCYRFYSNDFSSCSWS